MTTKSSFDSPSTIAKASLADLRILLLDMFCAKAYKEGEFILSSGQKSSYYINSKEITLSATGALAIGRLILSLLPDNTGAVAGLTLGADPIVTAVSVVSAWENRPIPALIVRKEAKGHGTKAYIEGPTLAESTRVTVLEDVVTTGRSAMQAVARLREVGYQVSEIIALVDRQQGGAEFYQSQGLSFQTLFSLTEIQNQVRKNT